MGVKITELIPFKDIQFASLKDKVVAIDSSLFLYQFLSTIRQPDGTPLMDSKGNVTSHLVGLFSRTTRLMGYGMRLVFVFDGKPPELKASEQQRRRHLKEQALQDFKDAQQRQDLEAMGKFAKRTATLTGQMVQESKELVSALGLPVVQAPSEAEAQASHMVSTGKAYCLATQDADALMFGATRIVRNLSLVGKRKVASKLSYQSVTPQLVELPATLNVLGVDHDQFIVLCMLVGTDYNAGGIKGIGPKNALRLVKEYGRRFDELFVHARWSDHFAFSWQEVFQLIKGIPVTGAVVLEWNPPDPQALRRLLVEQHDFSSERLEEFLSKLPVRNAQKALGDFL